MKKIILSIFTTIFFITGNANAAWIEQSINSTPSYDYSYQNKEEYNNNNNNYNNNYEDRATNLNENEINKQQPKKEVAYIQTRNSANYRVKFMYYIPSSLVNTNKSFPVIVFVPGLDGDGESEIPEEFYTLAETQGFGILTPTFRFNQADFDKQQSYQYPSAWAADALVSMLNRAKMSGLNYSKLYLVGFSAGAQFSTRFSLLRPQMVDACAILASGARVKPETKNNVKYFVGIGTMDSEGRRNNAQLFASSARALGMSVVYRQYPVDHGTTPEEIQDVVNFFTSVKNGRI